MGLFDKFRQKKETQLDFTETDSKEKVAELAEKELKDRYDDMVEDLLVQGKVKGYSCTPQYKGKSFVPSDITIVAKKDGEAVFTETIHIW